MRRFFLVLGESSASVDTFFEAIAAGWDKLFWHEVADILGSQHVWAY